MNAKNFLIIFMSFNTLCGSAGISAPKNPKPSSENKKLVLGSATYCKDSVSVKMSLTLPHLLVEKETKVSQQGTHKAIDIKLKSLSPIHLYPREHQLLFDIHFDCISKILCSREQQMTVKYKVFEDYSFVME